MSTLPGAKLSVKSLTDKDKNDLEFGIKNKVDFIAFSFRQKTGRCDRVEGHS